MIIIEASAALLFMSVQHQNASQLICVCVCGVAGGSRSLHSRRSRWTSRGHAGIPGVFTAFLETRASYWGVALCCGRCGVLVFWPHCCSSNADASEAPLSLDVNLKLRETSLIYNEPLCLHFNM